MSNVEKLLYTEFDSLFDKIENLTWYPWVGKRYKNNKRRILIVGESHYIHEETPEKAKSREEELKRNKVLTRECLYEVLVDKSWRNRTYPNFMEVLSDRGIISEDRVVLSKIAYYNFIQKQLTYAKDNRERPNKLDYREAWKCFLEVIRILKPTDCIIVGVGSAQQFEEVMNEQNVSYEAIETLNMINGVYPKRSSIKLASDDDLPIVFIKHSSAFFNSGQWHEFLKQQLPEAMIWLNSEEEHENCLDVYSL